MELAPAWRHVWARLIGGRDAPPAPLTSTTTTSSSSSSASDLLSEEALLARLGWCSAEWVRPPPDGQLAIGDAAATSLGEIAATNAAYQVRKQHPQDGLGTNIIVENYVDKGIWFLQLAAMATGSAGTRQRLVETVLSGSHAAYHASYALAALPSMAAGTVRNPFFLSAFPMFVPSLSWQNDRF
eukprot:COSAG06_NODE_2869_length_6155_cov_2.085757_1_plen_184_part_00